MYIIKGQFTRSPKFKVPSHMRLIHAISTIESMEVGTYHFTRGPKSYVPSMTWIFAWQHFLKVRLGTCVASCLKQKARLNSQPKSREYLTIF